MENVKHNGLSMSKLDIAKEIDFIFCGDTTLNCAIFLYGKFTYEELRERLFFAVQRYAPHRMCEFENLY